MILREHLIDWLFENGERKMIGKFPMVSASIGAFDILHGTPLAGQHPATHQYTLDVWKGAKVLNLQWTGNDIELVSFAPGNWDAELLDAIRSAEFA